MGQVRTPDTSWGEVLEASDRRRVGPRQPRVAALASAMEPLFWSLFSAGGIVAAVLLPVHVFVLGIAFSAGWLDDALAYDRIIGIVRFPLTRLYLWAVIALPLFHWAHRFRFIVMHQLGVHRAKGLIAAACYGAAVAGTALSGLVIWTI